MTSPAICVAFSKIAELCAVLGVREINKLAGCWEHNIDARWFVAVNGHREDTPTSKGNKIPPFNAYLECNGWPAGLIAPNGGTIVHGTEDEFIAAVEAAIAVERGARNVGG